MIKKEFFGLLRRAVGSGSFQAFVNSFGQVRLRRGKSCRCFCPIEAVVFFLTGKFVKVETELEAYNYLGIRESVSYSIIDAADMDYYDRDAWCGCSVVRARQYRRLLLHACGLPMPKRKKVA